MHPSAALLQEYAQRGCPVTVGQDWTLGDLEAAVDIGPHVSVLAPDAIDQMHVEAREKEKQGFANIFKWEELNENLPSKLKLSPLAITKIQKVPCNP